MMDNFAIAEALADLAYQLDGKVETHGFVDPLNAIARALAGDRAGEIYAELPTNQDGIATMQGCKKCGGEMKPGQAIDQTWTGTPDFAGGEIVTMSPGGHGNLIDCMKCLNCGWSVTNPLLEIMQRQVDED